MSHPRRPKLQSANEQNCWYGEYVYIDVQCKGKKLLPYSVVGFAPIDVCVQEMNISVIMTLVCKTAKTRLQFK